MSVVQLGCGAGAFAFRFLEGEGNSLFAFIRKGLLPISLNGPNQKREKYSRAQHINYNFHRPNVREAASAYNNEGSAFGCARKSALSGRYKTHKLAMNGRWSRCFSDSLESTLACFTLIASKQEERSWLTTRPSHHPVAVSGYSFWPEGLSLSCFMEFLQGADLRPSTQQRCQNKRQAMAQKRVRRYQTSNRTTHTLPMSGGCQGVSAALSVFGDDDLPNPKLTPKSEYQEVCPC